MSFAVYIILLSTCTAFILAKNSLTSKPVKALAVIMLIHGYVVSWSTYKEVSGYPTIEQVPKKFEIIWARVVESSSGSFIELWISYDNPILDKLISQFSLAHGWDDISRVYRLPYSDENHAMVLELQKKIEMGERVGIVNQDEASNNDLDIRDGTENYRIEFEGKKIIK